jgi:hypothetical protein
MYHHLTKACKPTPPRLRHGRGGSSAATSLRSVCGSAASRGLISAHWAGGGGKTGKDWLPHLLAPAGSGALQETKTADGIELGRKFSFVRGERPGQSVSGIVRCTVSASGPLRVDYDFEARDADGIWLEAGVGFAAPEACTGLHWIGRGPYATYPGKNLLGLYGRHALHRDDLYFGGNRQDVGAALLIDAAGNGIGLLPAGDDFNLSVERDENGIIAGHNAVVSGVGTKFKIPDVLVEPAKTPRLSGAFYMLPLKAGSCPEELHRIFGIGRRNPEPFRPYQKFHQ